MACDRLMGTLVGWFKKQSLSRVNLYTLVRRMTVVVVCLCDLNC